MVGGERLRRLLLARHNLVPELVEALPHVATQRGATVCMCIAAAAFDFGQAANWATIVDIGGRHAGVAMGLVNMLGNLGNATQPYVGAIVFNAFGFSALFAVYAAAFLLAATMWIVIDPTRTFYDRGDSR